MGQEDCEPIKLSKSSTHRAHRAGVTYDS